MKITVDGDTLTIDYTGSDTRPELQAWSTYGNTRGYTIGQIASMMDPEIPKNEGFFDQIRLVVPQGCVLNPPPGKPVSAGTHHPGADVGEVIAVAMQHVLPDKAVPQTYKTGIPTIIVGVDPRTGAALHRPLGRGLRRLVQRGEGHGRLGRARTRRSATSGRRRPRSTRACSRTSSGAATIAPTPAGPDSGAGSAAATTRRKSRVDATVYTYVVGMKYPMPGICGGKNGAPNEMIIRYGSDDPYPVAHTANYVPIAAGATSANSWDFRASARSRCCRAGTRSLITALVAAMWIDEGKTSFEDCDALTWSLGCTSRPSRSRRQRRDDLVGVHVARRARARLEDVDGEVRVPVAPGDLVGRGDDCLGDLAVEHA